MLDSTVSEMLLLRGECRGEAAGETQEETRERTNHHLHIWPHQFETAANVAAADWTKYFCILKGKIIFTLLAVTNVQVCTCSYVTSYM